MRERDTANIRTEARAIAQKLQDVVDGTDGWLNIDKAIDIIARTLTAKDVEMAKMELERDKWEQHACTGDDVLARTRSKLKRAEAQLAAYRQSSVHPDDYEKAEAQRDEALKALEEIADARAELGTSHDYSRGWNDALFRVRQIARRALTGGKNG